MTERIPILNRPTEEKPPITRRQFLARNLALLGALTFGEGLSETGHIELTRHRVPLPGLTAPLRVVQVTDLHRSWCVPEGFIAQVVERVNALKPDLIALTGDFVTGTSDYAPSCAGCLTRLRAPLGLFGVLGNHDYTVDSGHGYPAVAGALGEAQVQLLTNRSVRLENGLRLVGVDDARMGRPDPIRAFAEVRPGEPTLCMTHNPILFYKLNRYDCITLAGHTHGGQINFPFFTRGLLTERSVYLKGWFRPAGVPGRMYVSRGLGVVGIPIRFRARPEIALFDFIPV